MIKNKRIPLPSHLATRDSTLGKDGILKNFYEESTPLGEMIVKRPGQANSIALGPCVAQGSTFFNNNNYFICSNIIYVNPPGITTPPICPIPGSSANFGNANSNVFGFYDPVTGYIWASEVGNIHKIAIYNPVTASLVTEITIPSASGDTQGIFYMPNIRKMFTVTTATLGTNNLFVINPDTYAIEQSLSVPGGGGWQMAALCLDNVSDFIACYNGSLLDVGSAGSVNYLTYATSGAGAYPVAGVPISDFVYAPTLPVFAVLGTNTVVLISHFGNVKAATSFTFSSLSNASILPTAFDTVRQRFWVAESATGNLYYIPVTALTVGTKTLLSTIPAAFTQICYDSFRDVLWVTSTDGNLRKISPSTGAVVGTFSGASTFVQPGLVGTRLILSDSCTLIQNSGQGGNSFTKIGIQ